jgi:hypothetical protein
MTNTLYVTARAPELSMPIPPAGKKGISTADITPYFPLAGPVVTGLNDAVSLYFTEMQNAAKAKADASTAALKTVWASVAVEKQAHQVETGLLAAPGDPQAAYVRALEYKLSLYIAWAQQNNRACGLYPEWTADTDAVISGR